MSAKNKDEALPDDAARQARAHRARRPLLVVFVVFSLGLVVSGLLKVVMAPKIKEADVAELILTGLILLVVAIALIVMTVRGRRSASGSDAL